MSELNETHYDLPPYNLKHIPDEDYVLRNVHNISYRTWPVKDKRPNVSDFTLREVDGVKEDGLSCNWEKYCNENEVFVLISQMTSKKTGKPLVYKEFKLIRLLVGALEI